jgi:hypothetical protein
MTTSSVRAWTTRKCEARRLRQARVGFPPKRDRQLRCLREPGLVSEAVGVYLRVRVEKDQRTLTT